MEVLIPPCNNPIDFTYFFEKLNKSVKVPSFLLPSTSPQNLAKTMEALEAPYIAIWGMPYFGEQYFNERRTYLNKNYEKDIDRSYAGA